jgi:hypothetical protein
VPENEAVKLIAIHDPELWVTPHFDVSASPNKVLSPAPNQGFS